VVSNEEFDVFCAYDTYLLANMLWQKESLIKFCTAHGLPPEWLEDEVLRASVIKSELARRGVFDRI
jgi:hypothetical protein